MDTDNSSRPTNARRGNILVLAVIMLGAAMALIVQSSDSVNGTYQQISFKLREQKALAAAEAVAASQETELSNLLGTGDFRKVNEWTNNYGVQWFGDCQVKWKWEPVAVFEPKNPYDSNTAYVVNPDPDPNAVIPTGAKQNNQDLYHYRIATEATLTEKDVYGQDVVRCRAQAVRVVQMTLSRLFRYAIFYGQRGARGDIEFAHGPTLTVAGSVHSNGAIYLAGSNGPNGTNISSVQGGGTTNIGPDSKGKKVTVTAIDGIYRQNKRFNYYHQGGAGYSGPDKNVPDPMLIKDPLLISSNNNRFINTVSLTKAKDSLGDVNFITNSMAGAPTGWGGYLRTAVTKATVVNSLANIPGFAGRPLEPHLLSDAPGIQEWQRVGQFGVAATYTPGIGNPVMTTAPAAADLVNAINGPYLDFALGQRECGGSGRTDLAAIAATNSYDMHLEMTNAVTGVVSEVVPAIAGLIIRERPNGAATLWNGTPFNGIWNAGTQTWSALNGTSTPPARPSTSTTDVNYIRDKSLYALYMASRYQVFLGRLDITNEFFAYPTPAQATATRKFVNTANLGVCTATEDFFYNPREYYSQGAKAWTDTTIQRQSVLTLNMNAVQDFIRDITLANIASWTAAGGRDALGTPYLFGVVSGVSTGAVAPNTDTIRQHFSGLIYAHRTKRGGAYAATVLPEDFSNGIRIANGRDISWNHNAGANPLGTSKLTIVTPNQVFLWGDYNTVLYPDSAGTNQQTPTALMCDMLTVQSNNFSDANMNALAASSPPSTGWTGAATTRYNVALVENNAPTTQASRSDDASVHTFGWYMENWGGTEYHFKGSIVVLNSRRYCRGFNQGYNRQATPGVDLPPDRTSPAPVLYGAPTRYITFNDDLMSSQGTPPYSPFGVEISRQVNYSYVVMVR